MNFFDLVRKFQSWMRRYEKICETVAAKFAPNQKENLEQSHTKFKCGLRARGSR